MGPSSSEEMLSLLTPIDEFRHEALFYAGEEEFLSATSAFLWEGLEAGEPTLVLLSAPKIEALRSELGAAADRIRFADMTEVGANPARIIPAWREFVDSHWPAGRRLRGIGEPIWAGQDPTALVECQRHEALLNVAFANTHGFRMLCAYDTSAVGADVLSEARCSHPHLHSRGVDLESPDYPGLDEVAAPFGEVLPEPASQPHTCVFQAGTLAALRQFVSRRATGAGLTGDRLNDLVLAVNEVATNSVLHGGGGGIARVWHEGGAVVCEVGDRGRIADPLAGRERPALDQTTGYGLWLANQLCDLVQVRTFARGTAVRMRKY